MIPLIIYEAIRFEDLIGKAHLGLLFEVSIVLGMRVFIDVMFFYLPHLLNCNHPCSPRNTLDKFYLFSGVIFLILLPSVLKTQDFEGG